MKHIHIFLLTLNFAKITKKNTIIQYFTQHSHKWEIKSKLTNKPVDSNACHFVYPVKKLYLLLIPKLIE